MATPRFWRGLAGRHRSAFLPQYGKCQPLTVLNDVASLYVLSGAHRYLLRGAGGLARSRDLDPPYVHSARLGRIEK